MKQRQPFKDSRQRKEEVRQKSKGGDEQCLRCGNHQHKTRGECPDLREVYHQFEVTTESRKITTFYGPDGLYRYKRQNYGTKSAQDILQNEMRSILAGISNQINIADDQALEVSSHWNDHEHDQALERVLARLQDNGMTVNTGKCQFDVEETSFAGLTFNKKGTQPDPTTVKALHLAGPPKKRSAAEGFRPVVFKSRSLSPSESNYSTTEREVLAIRWGIKKLRKYLLGAQQFKMNTVRSRLPFLVAEAVLRIPSVKKHIEYKLLQELDENCKKLCSKKNGSILRKKDCTDMVKFQWSSLFQEMSGRCSFLLDVLVSCQMS